MACYLNEGCSFKEGRNGHASLQQSGRKDGEVTSRRAKVIFVIDRTVRYFLHTLFPQKKRVVCGVVQTNVGIATNSFRVQPTQSASRQI